MRALIALAMLWLSGCLQTATEIGSKDQDPPDAYDAVRRADLQPRFPQATANADTGGSSPGPVSYFGTPVEAVVKAPPASSDGSEGFALNFENTPVATVAKVVLGDILNVGYVIDPRAQGTISLSSGRPIAKSDMLFVLENALRVNNLVLVRDTVGYRILPATDGTVGGIDRAGANDVHRARIRDDGHPGPVRIGRDAGQVDGGLRVQARRHPNRPERQAPACAWHRLRAPNGRRHRSQFRCRLAAGTVGRNLPRVQ